MKLSPRLAACASLPRHGLYVAIYNTAVASLLTALAFGGGFFANFVYSQSIGLLAWLLIDGSRHLLWRDRRPPAAPMVLILAVSLLIASAGGTWLAASLLGHPWRAHSHLTSLLITAVAGSIAVFYFWEREKVARLEAAAAQEKSRAETVERQIAEARLRLLQAQIEPHFLFNTLANLQALIPADPARAQLMLDHLNEFLHAALAASRKERNSLADEFALLRDYLEILAIRMDKRLRYRLDLPESLAAAEMPPMLLQPLVENAVKHGLEPKIDGGEIAVRASAGDGRLVLEVTDTGLGLGAAPTAGTGAGIAQVRERLAAVYGGSASLEFAGNPGGGVAATLRLPLAA